VGHFVHSRSSLNTRPKRRSEVSGGGPNNKEKNSVGKNRSMSITRRAKLLHKTRRSRRRDLQTKTTREKEQGEAIYYVSFRDCDLRLEGEKGEGIGGKKRILVGRH